MKSGQDFLTLGSYHQSVGGVVTLVATGKLWILLARVHTESEEPICLFSIPEKSEKIKTNLLQVCPFEERQNPVWVFRFCQVERLDCRRELLSVALSHEVVHVTQRLPACGLQLLQKPSHGDSWQLLSQRRSQVIRIDEV